LLKIYVNPWILPHSTSKWWSFWSLHRCLFDYPIQKKVSNYPVKCSTKMLPRNIYIVQLYKSINTCRNNCNGSNTLNFLWESKNA
jgi:hypothetical protein